MDPRYKFIRSKDPFKGLEDYASSPELILVKNEIKYPIPAIQTALDGFEEDKSGYGLRIKLGYYFELLTQGIRGGKIKSPRELNNYQPNSVKLEPDVVLAEESCLWEAKAVAPGQSLKLPDEQISKYTHLQIGDYFSKPPLIVFEVFRHGIRGLIKNYKKEPLEKLVNNLTPNIKYMMSLPFSVIVEAHKADKNHTSRYDGERWIHTSWISSYGLNAMLAYPEETLDTLILNPDDFKIRKFRFPEGVKMNDREIAPFPVLVIRDKNHKKWLEDFQKNGRRKYPLLFGETYEEIEDIEKLFELEPESEKEKPATEEEPEDKLNADFPFGYNVGEDI